MAETLVAVKPYDIHTVNAEKLGISRGDAKAISYACVTEDTEVFSILNGWIPISKIKPETQKCVSVNTKDMINHYHTNIEKLHVFDDKEVFELYTDTGSIIKCTADHRWFVLDHDDNKYKYVETSEYFDGDYSIVRAIKGVDKNISYYKFKKMVSIGIQKTYCLTTETSNFYMRQNNFETLTGNCLYGASPGKLCKMLSLSEEEGEKLYKDYWDALPALKELKEKVEAYWESTGNSYILGIDGRKLMARSKHSLLNLLFQGGGSIAVKYSLVLAAQKMDEENILGDVFLDDYETSLHKVYQMIMYHDECQYAMPLSFFKSSYFDTEEEALEYKENNKMNTNVHFSEKMNKFYLVESNKLSEIILKAIDDTVNFLNIRVDLGMEYEVGRTWYDCH